MSARDRLLMTFDDRSSSVKVGLCAIEADWTRPIAIGAIDFRTSPFCFQVAVDHQSGLKGVSGFNADSRELLTSERAEARQGFDRFPFRAIGEIARLATTLGRMDALVVTARIGQHQAISQRLRWPGLALDPRANNAERGDGQQGFELNSTMVIPTDEEQVSADGCRHTSCGSAQHTDVAQCCVIADDAR